MNESNTKIRETEIFLDNNTEWFLQNCEESDPNVLLKFSAVYEQIFPFNNKVYSFIKEYLPSDNFY